MFRLIAMERADSFVGRRVLVLQHLPDTGARSGSWLLSALERAGPPCAVGLRHVPQSLPDRCVALESCSYNGPNQIGHSFSCL